MLKKTDRITRTEFAAYFKTGKRHHFPHLTIIHQSAEQFFGSVVVSKKVAKKAVKRNVLRRRIYEMLRTGCIDQGVTGVWIILLKPDFTSLSRKDAAKTIAAAIAAVLKKT